MYKLENILKRFAGLFNKSRDSNLSKLITIFSEQFQDIEQTNETIKKWRLIDDAEGVGLDKIGENIRQPRGTATDEIYRVLLKSKIARSLSTGDLNTIIRVLSIALDTSPSEIRIKEKWNDEHDPEPAAISVIEVPIKRLNEVGMDIEQFSSIVQMTVAAGVRVESVELQGTFEFGTIPMIDDMEKGFSDVDGEIGGYFGAAFKSGQDQELPM